MAYGSSSKGLCFFMLISASLYQTKADENLENCKRELEEWCKSNEFSERMGQSVSQIYNGDMQTYVSCRKDQYAIICDRDGMPWFKCSPDHVLTYTGQVSGGGSIDEDACEAIGIVKNNLIFDSEGLTQRFQETMRNFQDKMKSMAETLQSSMSKLGQSLSNSFSDMGQRLRSYFD